MVCHRRPVPEFAKVERFVRFHLCSQHAAQAIPEGDFAHGTSAWSLVPCRWLLCTLSRPPTTVGLIPARAAPAPTWSGRSAGCHLLRDDRFPSTPRRHFPRGHERKN